jgi:hypothetical protein
MKQQWKDNGNENQSIRESVVQVLIYLGCEVIQLVDAMRYNLEGRGFDS